MDDVRVGKESIVGALAFVSATTQIPARSLVVGNPAKVIKQLSDEQIAWKTEGTALYQALPAQCQASLLPCEPLREIEANRPDQPKDYLKWHEKK
jgi:carbonic anhydrase/acetyltransferase-like protein (isoleucine patch superfamily)